MQFKTNRSLLPSFIVAVSLLLTAVLPLHAGAAPAAEWATRNYPETGQDVAGPFLTYFDRYGGLAQFGYPLTPVRWENNYQVQYFERQRFEYHPDKAGTDFEVQLTRLGALLTAGRKFDPGTQQADSAANRWFAGSGHNLGGRFLAYWKANGGLTIYGLPISEEIKETSSSDGKEYIVQYFERARFEFHPENQQPYDVLLGRLGYDYLLKIDGKAPAIAAPPPAQTKATAPSTPATPADLGSFQGGINMTGWSHDTYASADSDTAVGQIAKNGVGWVALLTTWYQNNISSNGMAPDGDRTPTDDSLRHAIRQAHAAGLKVTLKPHVDNYDGAWRGFIAPSDLPSWFANYKNFILHYAQLAADEKVEQLVVGTEFYTLNTSQDTGAYWRPIIAAIRGVYSGKLTYGANWAKDNPEFAAITWWDALDYIGIDGYFPLSTNASPSVDELKNGWASYTDIWAHTYHWQDGIAEVQARWNMPVLFVEIGYASTPTGAAVYDIPQQNWADQQLQVRAYDAMFQVWSAVPWWRGVYPWNWDTNPNAGGDGDISMVLNNKPAMQTVGNWYKKLTDK